MNEMNGVSHSHDAVSHKTSHSLLFARTETFTEQQATNEICEMGKQWSWLTHRLLMTSVGL